MRHWVRVGHTQQLAYRRLSAREEWQAEVLALVPPDIAPIVDANLRAVTDLICRLLPEGFGA